MNAFNNPAKSEIETLSAVTLATTDMEKNDHFYESIRFRLKSGGADSAFTSFFLDRSSFNLAATTQGPVTWWGRVIFYVSDVDVSYRNALAAGLLPQFPPRDGSWGERYFHIIDPSGHELSFAKPLG